MKAVLTLALAGSALATNCQIPANYVTLNGDACNGPAAGYKVYGYCTSGISPTLLATTPADTVVELTTANAGAFTSAAAPATLLTGCVIPPNNANWGAATVGSATANAAAVLALTTLNPLTDSTTLCSTIDGHNVFNGAADYFRGVQIRCDRENNFFPSQGFEGAVLCAAAGVVTGTTADTWLTGSPLLNPVHSVAADTLSTSTEFTGDNALVCSKGCVLPPTICDNGVLAANIVGSGSGFDLAKCLVQPSGNGVTNSFVFKCASAGSLSPEFVATCAAGSNGEVAITQDYLTAQQCRTGATGNGAQLFPRYFTGNGAADFLRATQTAGEIRNFNTVTSTIRQAFTVPAFVKGRRSTYWNNNPAQALVQNGAVYEIDVANCPVVVGEEQTRCVQQTLNYWRCKHNVDFTGAVCTAGGAVIACPTHALGFRCPSGSKKGLLGLLGLLGLIPLLLLCCCLFFLCCIRRKKTEADVHFATFDPHAAPVCGSVAPVYATAVPTFGACATPYAVPSAVPCL